MRIAAARGCRLTAIGISTILRIFFFLPRQRHSKPEIEETLRYAEKHGWRVGGSHAWGEIYCPYNDKYCRCEEFCISSIWSTPKNAGTHAKQIKRVVDNCTSGKDKDTEE